MQIDVFTLLPHAFSWLTEQRPLAAVLGSGSTCGLWNYRDFTPLPAARSTTSPTAAGRAWCCGWTSSAPPSKRSTASYAGAADRRAHPAGRQLDQELVEELAAEEALTLLSARFEGFDERIVEHVATDAVSIGPYVLSGGELPAMVVLDAVARRLPGRAPRGERTLRELLGRARGRLEFPQYTRPAEFRGWRVPEVLLSGDHARIDAWRREQSRERTPS